MKFHELIPLIDVERIIEEHKRNSVEKKMPRYNHKQLIEWGTKVLQKYGFSDTNSRLTAEVLVEADLRGIYSHGLVGGSSLDDIFEKIKGGGIVVNSEPILIKRKYPTIAHIDANGGLGHPFSIKSANLAKDIARKHGTAKVYVFNSSHFGAAGIYSEMIAEDKDLVGIVTCTAPAWSVPFIENNNYDGAKKRLGTNPIAWSIPYENGIITIDKATTQKAVSPAVIIAKENEKIIRERGIDPNKIKQKRGAHPELKELPGDYLFSQSGEEIVYPPSYEFVEVCSVRTLGGTNFGHGGNGLCQCVELHNIIGGAKPGYLPTGSRTADGRVGHTFEAYKIDSLFSREETLSRLTEDIEDIKGYGGPNMLLPGQKEAECKKEFLEKGILYTEAQVRKLQKMGETAGVPFI